MKGLFTISLDFELHWGGFEKWHLETQDSRLKTQDSGLTNYNHYFLNTREVIPSMLALFKKYDVHVTWATVGMLLHESKAALLQNAPSLKPSYQVSNLSA